MLGLQGSASSSKEYQCGACSATFTGLAPLLVHQATHAGPLPMPTQRPSDFNPVDAPPPSLNTEENQSSSAKILSPPMYICDCGEEFRDFTVMMDHKKTHVSERQSPQSFNHEITKEKDDDLLETPCDMVAAQTEAALGEISAAGPSIDASSFKNTAADVNQEESAAADSSEDQSPVSAETDEQCDKATEETVAIEEIPEDISANDIDKTAPKTKPLMKILASAYGKHLMSPPSVDDDLLGTSIKEEPEVVVISPQTTKGPSSVTDMSAMQLKRFYGKPRIKTKAPSISRLLESSTKKIVSLTKIFSPVVVLETRQKFMDSSSDTYGKFQCSRCRRVFQDVDSLTEHHFQHKKQRIKCCRCCKQLIIGRVPLPDNHVCPQFRGKAKVSSHSFKSNPTNKQNIELMNKNPKKLFFCPVCKHNFTRRCSLKTHKCCESQPVKPSDNAVRIRNEDNISQSVGTQVRSIKVEDDSNPDLSNMSWPSPIERHHKNASFAASFMQVQDSQWTVPLNNEMEILTHTNKDSNAKGRHLRLSTIFRDGVRRYSCDKCHKTFGLSSNLCRHKKLCSIRPKGLGYRKSSKNISLNSNEPVFSCYVCGRNFNRKDNMMVHRRKCELRRTMIPNTASDIDPTSLHSNTSNITHDPSTEESDGGWSVMSLPSVLPRRVTCECGLGFTSPELLLEHLQKHAQESYTCPTCGMTVKSWADYEIHLQRHMHPQHHKRSQPLLLQFKKNMSELQQCLTAATPLETPNRFKNQNRKQPFACPKCDNAFASRCTLMRHLTWSRCRGDRAKTFMNL